MPQVKVIQPIAEQAKKLRVAAYARVSSDSADQLNSFATQVDYYTGYIQSKDEWEFAGLYADEAVSGTTADKRDDFQRLLADCRAGKIDRILVKSISRFARNTIDCLQTVRELKQLGVAVEFEKEGLDTGNMGSEMLLSILGAAAQEESLSISKNLKWSYRRRMKSGDFITCSAPIGYILKNKTLIPNPQEVPIVEYIFNSYLAGKGIVEIASELTEMEMRNKDGDTKRWRSVTILNILKNEKYIGDSLVQKRFTTEELPFQRKQNNGELPQYYIKNSHQGIIPIEVFEAVQRLLKQRSLSYAPKSEIQQFPLSKAVKCGLCGSTFYRKPKNQFIKWICYQHLKDKELCPNKAISQDEIYQAFLRVYNKLLDNKDSILKAMLNQLLELQAKTAFERPDLIAINEKISELVKQNHSLTRLQTKGCIDSAIFIERSNRNNQKIEELRREVRQLQGPDEVSRIVDNTKLLLELLEEAQPMLEFEPSVFKSIVQKIVVYPERFCFYLTNGLVLDEGR
ncbi:Transposon Tn3 resolvase [uncultured Ruminococcus sp.]|uniref:Recombinase family protein n=1 Tax=Hydrogeniiclostridium mannosilyticum TaxID=2764322 RepID=A0A328UMF9_9FIRM|nr:recombinase family protein [Hydrogeniiclostridium mannosilyticum]RAQ30115.1 recombinase family protein [Hydrogeniiclostridium mannosilyticum]SCH12274.1 Transposon Tn3 resolvase [uncultured Ruminococcus sp.]